MAIGVRLTDGGTKPRSSSSTIQLPSNAGFPSWAGKPAPTPSSIAKPKSEGLLSTSNDPTPRVVLPQSSSKPATTSRSTSRSTSYSTGTPVAATSSGTVAATAPAPADPPAPAEPPKPPSDEDWWKSDADYQVEEASLKSSLENALAELATKRSNFDQDFVTTLKNLGWDWNGDDQGSLDNVATGRWDAANQLGAYGRGFTNLNDDFASRGLMDSSFFRDAVQNYNTDYNNQFGNLTSQRNSFLDQNGEKTGAGAAANTEYQNALARARQSSLARRDLKFA